MPDVDITEHLRYHGMGAGVVIPLDDDLPCRFISQQPVAWRAFAVDGPSTYHLDSNSLSLTGSGHVQGWLYVIAGQQTRRMANLSDLLSERKEEVWVFVSGSQWGVTGGAQRLAAMARETARRGHYVFHLAANEPAPGMRDGVFCEDATIAEFTAFVGSRHHKCFVIVGTPQEGSLRIIHHAKEWGCRTIYDMHDCWRAVHEMGHAPEWSDNVERALVQESDACMVSHPSLEDVVRGYGRTPTGVVGNACDPSLLRAGPWPADMPSDKPYIIYPGSVDVPWFDREGVVALAAKLAPQVNVVVVGAMQVAIAGCICVGPRTYRELGPYLSNAKCMVLPLKDCEVVRYQDHLKVYDAWQMGLPMFGKAEGYPKEVPTGPVPTFADRVDELRKMLKLPSDWLPPQSSLESPVSSRPTVFRKRLAPVTVAVLAHGQSHLVKQCFESLLQNEDTSGWQLLLGDNGSPDDTVEVARRIPGVHVLEFGRNLGVSAGWNRLITESVGDPIVILNSDIIVHPKGITQLCQKIGGKVAQVGHFGGVINHRFEHVRFEENPDKHYDYLSGSAFALSRRCIRKVGLFDERFTPAYSEDVDYSLRVKRAGLELEMVPGCVTHLGNRTSFSMAEIDPPTLCKENARKLREKYSSGIHVTYVLPTVGPGGGPKMVYEHLNHLFLAGFNTHLFVLGEYHRWLPLKCPITEFDNEAALLAALRESSGIKVATWWTTAPLVLESCQNGTGVPAYFVQDIETSYYPDDLRLQCKVLDTYNRRMKHLTNSRWIAAQLKQINDIKAVVVPPGIDHQVYKQLPRVIRHPNRIFALARSHPLKNWKRIVQAWESLDPRPLLVAAGTEEMELPPGITAHRNLRDDEMAILYNEAAAFIQPSLHEGYGLPMLEAMACGCPVVTTRCEGNEEYIRPDKNCLIVPSYDAASMGHALAKVLENSALQERLRAGGLQTALSHQWQASMDKLIGVYQEWSE